MTYRKSFIAVAFLTLSLLSLGVLTGAEPVSLTSEEVTNALKQFTTEGLWAHIEFLADDKLEGREAGTPGYDQAAKYVASRFKKLGLAPGGDNNTYYQTVTFRSAGVKGASLSLRIDGTDRELELLKDFAAFADQGREESDVSAEVVFAGYGVSAPSLGYDDYAGVDVRGKIVAIVLFGAPQKLPGEQRSHLGSRTTKFATAAEHGAAGIIALFPPDSQAPWQRLAGFFGRRKTTTWISPDGVPGKYYPRIQAAAILNKENSAALFTGSGSTWEETWAEMKDSGEPQNVALKAEATIAVQTTHEEFTSPNVVGILPGSDPALKNEYVVFSAHLDHVGTREQGEDKIFNGAYDNASGTSTLIEIARAFASMPEEPRRSVLFLANTAEEKGLLGSDYFAQFPTTGDDTIVADINMDMQLMLYPLKGVAALGAEHSSMGGVMQRAFDHVGLEMVPDPVPQLNLFVRSDHYSFVKRGIPATFLVVGFESTDPEIDGKAVFEEWFKTTYHKPNDDTSQEMHLESGVKMAQVNFLAGYIVANEDARPTWNEGDFFGETYGK